ncbi:MAG: diaminopimelate decarboxylase [Myxococcota bacterium]
MNPRVPVDAVADVIARARTSGAWTETSRAVLFHDLDRLEARVDELVASFPDQTLHAVAIKANPLVELLRVVVERGAGLEAASFEEVTLALAAGCAPDRIVYDSPAKTVGELDRALDLGLWINADSRAELLRLAELGAPRAARVGLRVNPGVGSGVIAATSTVGRASRFGVPLDEAAALVREFPFVTGLHVHTGSQGCDLDLLTAAARATAEVAEALDVAWLDIGGGVPVRYTDDDPEPPTLGAWAEALSTMPGWSHRRLVTEVGRSVHAGPGFAVSRIEAVKPVDGVPTLVVHLGADLLLRRAYRPQDWNHELVVLDAQGRPKTGERQPTHVVGPLCFSGDRLADLRPLPPAEPGDLLLVRDTGAYTLAMWSRHCSRGMPPSWGFRTSDLRLLHPGEQPEDVARFWSVSSSR